MYSTSNLDCLQCSKRKVCCFRELDDEAMESLTDEKRTLIYARGETIFHLEDPAQYFYCIESGRVQLFRSSPNRDQSFTIKTPGAWIGFRDAISNGSYRHSARVLEETIVCRYNRDLLDRFIETRPAFARSLTRELAEGWTRAEHQTYNLGARRVTERLADFLLELEQNSGDKEEIAMPLTREVLATLLGTTTETVIRTLSDFKSRGWIDMRKGRVTLKERGHLARLVAES